MSSSTLIATLIWITQEINIFVGIPIFIAGVIGGLLTIIVFLSLNTFRQSPCAFYFTIMSFVNITQLLIGLLSRIMVSALDIDWTQLSIFYSTIDQYLATCHRPHWQGWSNLKVARCLTATSMIFCLSIAIPYLIYYTHYVSPMTGQITCTTTNDLMIQLNVYFYRLIMNNILPLFLTLLFGLLTYRNIQQIAYRTVPLVRRELDKQLTAMILVQDIFTFITLFPSTIIGFISFNPNITANALVGAQFQLANVIILMFYYLYFAGPFYIYVCFSERFRRQLKYVLLDIHLNRCRKPRPNVNQVVPEC